MPFEFKPWPKTPRLFREVVITEKIDGTNGAIHVSDDGLEVGAQSRNRLITPDDDNFGFARWVYDNAGALADTLGPGVHYGEWWGSKIGRGYGLTNGERRFSLFNTARWDELSVEGVDSLSVVPVIYDLAKFDRAYVNLAIDGLREYGSLAAPGFMNPEGIIVYHKASRQVFKATLDNDGQPKSLVS
jgi:hypothetical protein